MAAAARNLDLPGRRVLVAVSGGVDSVVLLPRLATAWLTPWSSISASAT